MKKKREREKDTWTIVFDLTRTKIKRKEDQIKSNI